MSVEIPRWSGSGTLGECAVEYRANPLLYFLEPYEKLGPVFRVRLFGTELVAMGGVEANRFTWANNHLWDYHRTNAIFREQFSDRYLNQLEGEAYTKKRRRTNMGFKPSALMGHTPDMSRILFEEIDKLNGQPIDFSLFWMRVQICMTARALIQEDLPPGLDETMAIANKEMLSAGSRGKWRHLWYYHPGRVWRRAQIFRYLGSIIDRRKKNPAAKDDILSLILSSHPKDEPPIPPYELVHDLSQLFMGGSTTTSQQILWALIFVAQHPEWAAELKEELATWDPFHFESMKPWPKLRATVMEIERMRPSVPTFRRYAKETFEFGGYRIEAGTPILHLHALAHFLPEVYERPLEFRPQRFLENPDLPAKEVHGTFGGGNHFCVGQPLARILTPLAVADVLKRYHIEWPDGLNEDAKYDVVTTPKVNPVMVKLRKVSSS